MEWLINALGGDEAVCVNAAGDERPLAQYWAESEHVVVGLLFGDSSLKTSQSFTKQLVELDQAVAAAGAAEGDEPGSSPLFVVAFDNEASAPRTGLLQNSNFCSLATVAASERAEAAIRMGLGISPVVLRPVLLLVDGVTGELICSDGARALRQGLLPAAKLRSRSPAGRGGWAVDCFRVRPSLRELREDPSGTGLSLLPSARLAGADLLDLGAFPGDPAQIRRLLAPWRSVGPAAGAGPAPSSPGAEPPLQALAPAGLAVQGLWSLAATLNSNALSEELEALDTASDPGEEEVESGWIALDAVSMAAMGLEAGDAVLVEPAPSLPVAEAITLAPALRGRSGPPPAAAVAAGARALLGLGGLQAAEELLASARAASGQGVAEGAAAVGAGAGDIALVQAAMAAEAGGAASAASLLTSAAGFLRTHAAKAACREVPLAWGQTVVVPVAGGWAPSPAALELPAAGRSGRYLQTVRRVCLSGSAFDGQAAAAVGEEESKEAGPAGGSGEGEEAWRYVPMVVVDGDRGTIGPATKVELRMDWTPPKRR